MEEVYPTKDVAPRAAGYGIPYEIVDGQDVETVYDAAVRAVAHARSGKGPYLVEYKTFRMALHYSGDHGGYVNPEDLKEWGERDPIELCRRTMLERRFITADEDDKLRQDIHREVAAAVKEALAGPHPTQSDLFADVYAGDGAVS
jgi:pyruvate dehydrogenase E1 component alpha subunit